MQESGSVKSQLDELKELAEFGYGLANAVGTALEDGNVEIKEAMLLIPVAMIAPVAFNGAAEGIKALKSLNEADAQVLKAHLKEKFDIPQDDVEAKFEAAVGLALDVWSRIQVFLSKKA